MKRLAGERRDADLTPVAGAGVVTTASPCATEAAAQMLRAGGNAIDAAVAAAWALAVCEPSGSGLGGKTVLLIRFADRRSVVLEGRSPAPAAASRKQVRRRQQRIGYRACAVPSTTAVLGEAQRRYGGLSVQRVIEPAIRLAEEGYPVTRLYRRQLKWCAPALRASPAVCRLFLRDGSLWKEGEIFRQPALAATLRRLAQAGPDDFYTGQVARELVADMARHDGLITLQDLAECARPDQVEPITAAYRGHQLLSVPPPGGGLQVLLALKILEQFPTDELRREPDRWYEVLAQLLYVVFRERDQWSVTPRQLTPSLRDWMLSAERAVELFRALDHRPVEWPAGREEDEEPGETTHLCTADSQGNVVSLTQSLQSLFGAKVANAELGFLYNNCLRTCPRYPHPYQLEGRGLCRSNLAPTLVLGRQAPSAKPVLDARQPGSQGVLALGAAGSRRIISSIVQVISSVVDGQMRLTEALRRPRIHVLLSGKVHLEKPAATPVLEANLARRYRALRIRAPLSYFMGAVQALRIGAAGETEAAADPRRDGTATEVKA